MNTSNAAAGGLTTAAVGERPAFTPRQVDFLAQLAILLGMQAEDGLSLVAPRLVTGPSGLTCRLHLMHGEAAVRPEALLPMSADELAGPEINRLLSIQALLLGEFGWYLGLSSEGVLQLSSLAWIDDPKDAATALDLANGVGTAVLHSLLHDDSAGSAPVRH